VTIRIYYDPKNREPYTFEISAVMNTGAPCEERDPAGGAPTENEALRRAVRLLTQDYEDAVRRGELPDDRWLVEAAVPE
jgi:hypothetical protein